MIYIDSKMYICIRHTPFFCRNDYSIPTNHLKKPCPDGFQDVKVINSCGLIPQASKKTEISTLLEQLERHRFFIVTENPPPIFDVKFVSHVNVIIFYLLVDEILGPLPRKSLKQVVKNGMKWWNTTLKWSQVVFLGSRIGFAAVAINSYGKVCFRPWDSVLTFNILKESDKMFDIWWIFLD